MGTQLISRNFGTKNYNIFNNDGQTIYDQGQVYRDNQRWCIQEQSTDPTLKYPYKK